MGGVSAGMITPLAYM